MERETLKGWDRLDAVRKSPERLIVGLMSGTSHDGVDAALVRIRGEGPFSRISLLRHTHLVYEAPFRERIGRAFSGATEEVCRLDAEMGEVFARAVLKCLSEAGVPARDVAAVASHGQTLFHVPPAGGHSGATLQVGEAAVISERTGILTLSDFRPRDVAAGGQGAPLVPYADWILFHEPDKTSAVQNLGGIANVTVVTPEVEDVTAFDTGPGNALIDEVARIATDGREPCDWDGETARKGKANARIAEEILEHPYFWVPPPKSTGRETFGAAFAGRLFEMNAGRAVEDLLAAVTVATADSIVHAYRDFVQTTRRVDRVILCGGGVRNKFLVHLLREGFSGLPVVLTDEMGIPAEAKEAVSFAILGNELLAGNPANLPRVTGARHPVLLGKISLP